MADVKIPVSASVQSVTNELDKIPAKVEVVSRKINKFKWQVIDLKAVEADLKRLEGMISDFQKRTGGLGLGAGQAVPGAPGMAPGPLYRPPAGHHPAAPGGGGGGGRPRGPGAYTHAPQWWDAGRSLLGGFGGGLSQVGAYGVRGGVAGFTGGGGMAGAGMGLLRGLGIGALAYGAFKVGEGVNEGHEMAKERLGSIDAIKRQMGDLGVSFIRLKTMSDAAADGMAMNSVEAAKLMERYARESRGADRTPEGLMRSVRTSTGVSKAYGLDPGAGIGFFGGMRNIDPKQNNRELALILGETIERSGMNARADEVMQVVQSFAATTSRMSLSAPNVSAHAGAYSSLMSSRLPGMTSDVAASLLGQANSSLMGMGGAGEAGQNFILSSMQRNGRLNPIQAKALAAGGLFGTRASVFGKGSALGRYFGDEATNLASGPGANVANFDAIREQLAGMGGDKWLQLEGAQRLYGLSTPQQAAALLNMNTGEFGGLKKALGRAGVGLSNYNEKGIQTLSKIGVAGSMQELSGIFSGMRGRAGKGALTGDEVATLSAAQSTGDTEKFRDALIKIASSKDYEETQFTVMKDQQSLLEQIKINTGDKLVPLAQDIKGGLTALVGRFAPDSDYMKQQKEEARLRSGPQTGGASGSWTAAGDSLMSMDAPKLEAYTPALKKLMGPQKGGPDSAGVGVLSAAEQKYGLPAGLLKGMWGAESSFGKNTGFSSAGASGHLQWMPGTAKQYGVTIGDLNSEADGAGRYLRDLYKKRGSWKGALFGYNGVVNNTHLGEDYVRKVEKFGGLNIEDSVTPLPPGTSAAGSGRGFVNPSPVDVSLILHPQNQQFQSMGPATSARVSIPRGAGTAR